MANRTKRAIEIEKLLSSLAAAVNDVGRPTKYTAECVLTILDLLEEGNTLKTAALLSGVTYQTLNEWRKDYSDFSEAVDNAQALAERFYQQQIRGASKSDWNAAKFWLTHRNGDDWRPPKETKEVTGKDGAPVGVKVFTDSIANEV
jgi:hypothetical protein